MKTFKIILKKLSEIPPVHIGGIVIALMVIHSLISMFLGQSDFKSFKDFFSKAIILLIMVYIFYFKTDYNDVEETEVKKEIEEEPEELVRYYVPPEFLPGASGINYTVEFKTPEINEADNLAGSIEKVKISKTKNLEDKKDPAFGGPKPSPKPIVEEGKSKAEQEGNTILNEDGKPVVKPNYKMIASEWVKNNLELLNKICNDAYALAGSGESFSATIPAAYLPAEKASWIIIGKTLVAEDDISSFKLLKEGLEITVS